MAGDIKLKYAASSSATVTNLQALAASATLIAGWGGASIDNSSNVYQDYLLAATFKTSSANRQAGYINVYVIGVLADGPTFGSLSSGTAGTEGAVAFADTYRRDAQCVLLKSIYVGETGSATIYDMAPQSIANAFGGSCPKYWYPFVTTNIATSTNAALAASSGSSVYITPVYGQYT